MQYTEKDGVVQTS